MEIQTPTIHSFAKFLLQSAIRIKNVQLLDSLFRRGIKLDSVLDKIALMGDNDFTRRVIETADPACFQTNVGGRLFHHLVEAEAFDLARILLDGGFSMGMNLEFEYEHHNYQPALSKAIHSNSMKSVLFFARSACRYQPTL